MFAGFHYTMEHKAGNSLNHFGVEKTMQIDEATSSDSFESKLFV